MDSVLEYVEAETSRISTLPDVEPADRSVSQNSLKLKRFLKTTIRNAPKAPTPPASVGVKMCIRDRSEGAMDTSKWQ